MSIALFIIFLFMNFFILLIMKVVYASNYSYSEGMLLGVHIPKEHIEDVSVQDIVTAARHQMNLIIWINLIIGTALCFVVFWEIIIFVLAYTIWMIAFCILITYANTSAHRKMYALKMENDWIIPDQRRKRYIDTNVSAQIGRNEISYNYHGILLLVELICLLPFVAEKSASISTIMIIIGLCSVLISLTSMIFHIYVNRHEHSVYSEDTQINQTVSKTMKIYKGLAMLLLSTINAVAWIYVAIDTLIHCISSVNESMAYSFSAILHSRNALSNITLCTSAFYIYIFIQTLAVIGLFVPLIMAQNRKHELLATDTQPLYVDDDEYWKTGYYYNPSDSHVLVQNRLQSGNYTFNYATRGATIFTGLTFIIITACIAWMIGVLVPFINVHIDTQLDSDKLAVSAAIYSSEIYFDDIEEVQLLDELPDDHFVRTNGGDTDEYMIGHFKGNTYGKCEMYVYTDSYPIIMIKTRDEVVFLNTRDSDDTYSIFKSIRLPDNRSVYAITFLENAPCSDTPV